MLDLKNVTLVMCSTQEDKKTSNEELIEKLKSKINFGRCVVLSNEEYRHVDKTFIIEKMNSLEDYSYNCFHAIPKVIDTPFSMWIQWDGFPLDIDKWNPEFLEYDYIGAPWAWRSWNSSDGGAAGMNGGFSLRSKRLTDLMDRIGPPHDRWHEDAVVTDLFRKFFLQERCRFAPIELAGTFSKELNVILGTNMTQEQSIALDEEKSSFKMRDTFGFHNKERVDEAKVIFERNFK